MVEEYEMRETFEDKGMVSGIVLVTGDVLKKLELVNGRGVILNEISGLIKLRSLVDRAILDYEKSADRRV